jgi:hypothetical protein
MKRLVTMSALIHSGTHALQQLLHHDHAVNATCLLAANLLCLPSRTDSLAARVSAFRAGAKAIAHCPRQRLMRRYGVGTSAEAVQLLASSLAVSLSCISSCSQWGSAEWLSSSSIVFFLQRILFSFSPLIVFCAGLRE